MLYKRRAGAELRRGGRQRLTLCGLEACRAGGGTTHVWRQVVLEGGDPSRGIAPTAVVRRNLGTCSAIALNGKGRCGSRVACRNSRFVKLDDKFTHFGDFALWCHLNRLERQRHIPACDAGQ